MGGSFLRSAPRLCFEVGLCWAIALDGSFLRKPSRGNKQGGSFKRQGLPWVLRFATMGNRMTVQEQMKANKRIINRAIRELDRERAGLEREKAKLEREIKKLAKQNEMVSCISRVFRGATEPN